MVNDQVCDLCGREGLNSATIVRHRGSNKCLEISAILVEALTVIPPGPEEPESLVGDVLSPPYVVTTYDSCSVPGEPPAAYDPEDEVEVYVTAEEAEEFNPLENILAEGYNHPVQCAKELRKLFQANDWPNRHQPRSVRSFLEEWEIPIFDVPNGNMTTEAQGRQMRRDMEAAHARSL